MALKSSTGPFGGPGGTYWDEGTFDGVKQIALNHGEVVYSVKFRYAKDGGYVWGEQHGGTAGANNTKVDLNFPNEYLKSVSGYYNLYRGYIVINSLKFETNINEFGPFGTEVGDEFSFPTSNGIIVGFRGRSSTGYIDAIGGHVIPIPDPLGGGEGKQIP